MLEEFNSYRENNRLEAKEAKNAVPKDVWPTYSAFANTAGGVILLGVKEMPDHSLVPTGVSDPQKIRDDFWNTVNNRGHVSATVVAEDDVRAVELENGATIVRIDVPRADRRDRPVYLHENLMLSYRRRHTGDYKCSTDEIGSMLRDAKERGQDGKALPDVGMDELCQETVRGYRAIYRQVHEGHPWTKKEDDEFLRLIGAAARTEDGTLHPTEAGLLMFGWDWRISEVFPHYFLDYRQQTSLRERWQDRVVSQGGDWSGNVLDFYHRVYNLAKQALKTPFKLVGDRRDDDTPAHKALREALANCLTNANYHERRGVVVLWELDRITISNPGDFRISMERALMGGTSDPRNESMLRIFSYIEVGERAGSGVPAIVDDWTECGYGRPFWSEEFGPDRTTLTLPLAPASDGDSTTDSTGGGQVVESSGRVVESSGRIEPAGGATLKAAILRLAQAEGGVTRARAMKELGIGSTWASKLLKEMADEGDIVAEGSTRSRVYRAR